MPRGKATKTEAVKRAADRAEATSRGEEAELASAPLDAAIKPLVDGRGRPTEFDVKFVSKVQALCEDGATDEEIAQSFGVSTRTIYRWKLQHKDFCQAIAVGKEIANTRVERTLYQKAVGYTYVEQQAIKVKTGKDTEEVKVIDVERYAQPEIQAVQFWLKNRKPQVWRDVQQIEHGRPGEFQQMSDDELRAWLLKEAPQTLTLITDESDGKRKH